jgi:hypothetical protein
MTFRALRAIVVLLALGAPFPLDAADVAGWPVTEGAPGGGRYSPLADVTPENVRGCAWSGATAGASDASERRAGRARLADAAVPAEAAAAHLASDHGGRPVRGDARPPRRVCEAARGPPQRGHLHAAERARLAAASLHGRRRELVGHGVGSRTTSARGARQQPRPRGEAREAVGRGSRLVGLDQRRPGRPGLPGYGPPLATASGLVFHAGTRDPVLRVQDTASGALVTTFALPAGLHAGAISYRLRPDGPQLLVIAPGGHVGVGSPLGDHVIAYALPDAATPAP